MAWRDGADVPLTSELRWLAFPTHSLTEMGTLACERELGVKIWEGIDTPEASDVILGPYIVAVLTALHAYRRGGISSHACRRAEAVHPGVRI